MLVGEAGATTKRLAWRREGPQCRRNHCSSPQPTAGMRSTAHTARRCNTAGCTEWRPTVPGCTRLYSAAPHLDHAVVREAAHGGDVLDSHVVLCGGKGRREEKTQQF
jgi:hypothetical protein